MLFDEVEKAHPEIFNIFLQMLDEGTITGSNGKKVTCKNSVIIMTSNLGSADSERLNIGFGSQEKTGEDDKALKEFFKPEFRNRLDYVGKFNKLDMISIKKIVVKFFEDLKKSLQDKHNISLNLTEPVIDYLADKGYDNKMGARPLARKIDELIRVPLSKKILFENIKNATITPIYNGNEIEFNSVNKLTAKVNDDGIITVNE
jgi:ATP-dependent Clp protease ATP-binding subunit ClpA